LNCQGETKGFRQGDPLTLDQHIGVRMGGSQTSANIYALFPIHAASARFGVPVGVRTVSASGSDSPDSTGKAPWTWFAATSLQVSVIITIALRRLSANLWREERPVSDLCDSAPSPSVLEGSIETDLARQLNRSVRTLRRLAATRSGSPLARSCEGGSDARTIAGDVSGYPCARHASRPAERGSCLGSASLAGSHGRCFRAPFVLVGARISFCSTA
jgi:hypothetical protein